MIKTVYEGDTILINVDLSGKNLPTNPKLTFVVDIGNGKIIQKIIDSNGRIKLSEKDTLGLDGVYPCEIRLNNAGMTKVLWQDTIKVKNSLTVSGEPTSTPIENTEGGSEVGNGVGTVEAISNAEISFLF